jgi:hypothetical protein
MFKSGPAPSGHDTVEGGPGERRRLQERERWVAWVAVVVLVEADVVGQLWPGKRDAEDILLAGCLDFLVKLA